MSIKRPHGVYGRNIAEEFGGGEAQVPFAIFFDGNTLTAYCPEFEIQHTSTDIRELRTKMLKAIDEKVSFKWEPWLEVQVNDFKNEKDMFLANGDKMQLSIEVERFETAVRNGEHYYRHPGSTKFMKGKKEPKSRKVYSQHSGMHGGTEYYSVAIIRDTPEAREALKKLQAGMETLSSRVMDLLSQDNINKAIAGLLTGGSLLALPAPTTKRKKRT